jgi:LmbE family N-acetylglucosaminyl deacetylase
VNESEVWSPPAGAAVHVPDATAMAAALSRTTDLAIVAHPDDLELSMPSVVLACRDDPGRHLTGVICTDGAGSVLPDGVTSAEALVAMRADEQRAAADLGGLGALVLLGLPSGAVRAQTGEPNRARFITSLAELVRACRPVTIHTHNPADAHDTHVAVVTAVITAVRLLPVEERPATLLGWAGWRDLDWLPGDVRVTGDLTGHEEAAMALAACHASQLGPKRYDLGAQGRRRANATFAEARQRDAATEVSLAMDLGATLAEGTDPAEAVLGAIDRFRAEVAGALRQWW